MLLRVVVVRLVDGVPLMLLLEVVTLPVDGVPLTLLLEVASRLEVWLNEKVRPARQGQHGALVCPWLRTHAVHLQSKPSEALQEVHV